MTKEQMSRKLSYLLRHDEQMINEYGWADVSEIIRKMQEDVPAFDQTLLSEIIAEDKKKRYSYGADKRTIRANQGHSLPVKVEMREAAPPDFLYHGTAQGFLPRIFTEGLTPQKRNFVHLSKDIKTAGSVGARHKKEGDTVILRVETGSMYRDGFKFWISENEIWQGKHVPREYISVASWLL